MSTIVHVGALTASVVLVFLHPLIAREAIALCCPHTRYSSLDTEEPRQSCAMFVYSWFYRFLAQAILIMLLIYDYDFQDSVFNGFFWFFALSMLYAFLVAFSERFTAQSLGSSCVLFMALLWSANVRRGIQAAALYWPIYGGVSLSAFCGFFIMYRFVRGVAKAIIAASAFSLAGAIALVSSFVYLTTDNSLYQHCQDDGLSCVYSTAAIITIAFLYGVFMILSRNCTLYPIDS